LKLAIYQKDGGLSSVFEDIENPRINGQDLYSDKGSFFSINENHILLDNDVEVPDVLSDELLTLDKKASIPKFITVEEENADLKTRLDDAEMAIISLMDFM
jgi:hypothetical protein